MIAGTLEDLVMGMCMHFEMVPTPAPTPTPIPHPFVSMIGDPGTAAASAVVTPLRVASGQSFPKDRQFVVNGLHMANTGMVAKNSSVLPHVPLPPGTGWAPMPKAPKPMVGVMETPPPPDSPANPAGDCVLHQGSQTVCFGKGKPLRLGDPTMSCSEPSRMQSTVLAVPKGPPVMIGG